MDLLRSALHTKRVVREIANRYIQICYEGISKNDKGVLTDNAKEYTILLIIIILRIVIVRGVLKNQL